MKKRNEIPNELKWDFTHIFKTSEAWEKAYLECEDLIPFLSELKGTLSLSAESLFAAYERLYGFYEKFDRVADYAFLAKTVDGGDTRALTMCDRVTALSAKAGAAAAFFNPELMEIPAERLAEFMQYEPLKKYAHIIEDATRLRDHVLDEQREALIAKIGKISVTPSDAYSMLTNVEMALPAISGSDNKKTELTGGNFGVMRESHDRALREAAFEGMFGTYGKYINTIACLYGGSVKQDNLLAEVRGYKSAREASLAASNVPERVYDALIEAIRESIPSMNKYLKLRKKALGLEKLDVYDLYTPIVEDVEYPMPYEEACELVLKAVAPLGEEYQNVIRRAYRENWIDVYETPGKEAGAFSAGIYGIHPFIKLNYADSLDDAFTLAHELGHAMHSYLSSEKQDYANHDYRLIVAEVASTCNEVLLTKYLLKTETDKKRRAYILNDFLEGFRTTVFRQTLFAEFEHKAHRLEAEGASINAEVLNEVYKDLVKTYYPEAEFCDTLKYEWAFIPHFYNSYYVYQYATGFSSAVAIASRILETGDASHYLRFLSSGGSDYPLNELKIAGIDLCSPDVVKSAIKVFDETIDELEALL
ncbi:MAG: oligoendopeptidase F [Firmicutes bacterium]|nr:oligoendopeptidase F [[Eubacterium] siraeum]MCM1488861.1 oligoendopeptidase F [Bacillota bacterium]